MIRLLSEYTLSLGLNLKVVDHFSFFLNLSVNLSCTQEKFFELNWSQCKIIYILEGWIKNYVNIQWIQPHMITDMILYFQQSWSADVPTLLLFISSVELDHMIREQLIHKQKAGKGHKDHEQSGMENFVLPLSEGIVCFVPPSS